MTGEYRHKTITPTYLAEPRRGRVVVSKLLASALGGAVVAVVAGAVALVFGFSVVGAGIGDVNRMLTEYRHVFPGVLAAAILYAIYGVGLGALLKNQVVAIVVGLGVTAILEPIIVGVVPSVGKWLPGPGGPGPRVGDGERQRASTTASPTWCRGGRAAWPCSGTGWSWPRPGPSRRCARTSPR